MAQIYFSKKENGFFRDDIHNNMPEDIVQITAYRHKELMDGQSAGMDISSDDSGNPVLKKRPEPSLKDKWLRVKMEVARLLYDTDYVMLIDVPCSNIDEFKKYRDELRNISSTFSSPENIIYPEKPVYKCSKQA
jgi:Phage tail assembly chaperone protein